MAKYHIGASGESQGKLVSCTAKGVCPLGGTHVDESLLKAIRHVSGLTLIDPINETNVQTFMALNPQEKQKALEESKVWEEETVDNIIAVNPKKLLLLSYSLAEELQQHSPKRLEVEALFGDNSQLGIQYSDEAKKFARDAKTLGETAFLYGGSYDWASRRKALERLAEEDKKVNLLPSGFMEKLLRVHDTIGLVDTKYKIFIDPNGPVYKARLDISQLLNFISYDVNDGKPLGSTWAEAKGLPNAKKTSKGVLGLFKKKVASSATQKKLTS
jgi:hypothetical protein